MKSTIEKIKPYWYKNQPISINEIISCERGLRYPLPDDLKEFFLWSNGGEGPFHTIYISLWPLEEVQELNNGYLINHYLGEEFIAFGSDGGPICFLIDYRIPTRTRIASVNFGDLDVDEVKIVADSFRELLDLAHLGMIDGNEL